MSTVCIESLNWEMVDQQVELKLRIWWLEIVNARPLILFKELTVLPLIQEAQSSAGPIQLSLLANMILEKA